MDQEREDYAEGPPSPWDHPREVVEGAICAAIAFGIIIVSLALCTFRLALRD